MQAWYIPVDADIHEEGGNPDCVIAISGAARSVLNLGIRACRTCQQTQSFQRFTVDTELDTTIDLSAIAHKRIGAGIYETVVGFLNAERGKVGAEGTQIQFDARFPLFRATR